MCRAPTPKPLDTAERDAHRQRVVRMPIVDVVIEDGLEELDPETTVCGAGPFATRMSCLHHDSHFASRFT